MRLIIPAAGNGRRFVDAGYEEPKPMIDVCGKPMVVQVVQNLAPTPSTETIIIARKEHGLSLGEIEHGKIIELDHETEGAVSTILKAEEYLKGPVLIGNCDQLVDFDASTFVDTDLDGRLVVFPSSKPHHSYVKSEDGIVTEIAEKEVISHQAVTGVYFFKSGENFAQTAKEVIANEQRTKGEFYVSSVIDQMIKDGKRIGVFEAPSTMLGTPEELQHFLVAVRMSKKL